MALKNAFGLVTFSMPPRRNPVEKLTKKKIKNSFSIDVSQIPPPPAFEITGNAEHSWLATNGRVEIFLVLMATDGWLAGYFVTRPQSLVGKGKDRISPGNFEKWRDLEHAS